MALARRLLTKEELQESTANEMEDKRFLAESFRGDDFVSASP